jgi:hypothetical protein
MTLNNSFRFQGSEKLDFNTCDTYVRNMFLMARGNAPIGSGGGGFSAQDTVTFILSLSLSSLGPGCASGNTRGLVG